MSNISTAHTQWKTRPYDERFISLTDMNQYLQEVREQSHVEVVSTKNMRIVANDHNLSVIGATGQASVMTNWSFGQLAMQASAPASYLRGLNAELAADCLNHGLLRGDGRVGALFSTNKGQQVLRALTGPKYGRIWNSVIAQALIDRFGDGLNGQFRVPGSFGQQVAITKTNTTLYASDRDMFVFLADETNKIEVPDRRSGQPGFLSRGFFVWNSEVGASCFGVGTFLFDYVCENRIIWGASEYRELRLRHTAKAPERWLDEISPMMKKYAESSSISISQTIAAAQKAKVEVDLFLKNRQFSERQVALIKERHLIDEQRPMESLWDVAVGITALARDLGYQDDRIGLERKAGQILDVAM
ncbi:MAG: hypothetical protein H7839_12720 [Magnetococcus sp. YQC-5]